MFNRTKLPLETETALLALPGGLQNITLFMTLVCQGRGLRFKPRQGRNITSSPSKFRDFCSTGVASYKQNLLQRESQQKQKNSLGKISSVSEKAVVQDKQ